LVEEKFKEKYMTGCAGRYHHKPESFNKDVYRRIDGHMLYYYSEEDGTKGSWRTTHATSTDSADPSSPSLGSGLQYPAGYLRSTM